MKRLAGLLLMVSAGAHAGPPTIYNCDYASGNDVLDLACNVYFEAGHEPLAGKYMVGQVVLNRMASKHYPDTVSEVVYEIRRDRRTGKRTPMFSWTLDGKPDRVTNPTAWQNAMGVAVELVYNTARHPDMTFGAKWYHADYLTPYWAPQYHRTVKVGRHIFYAQNEKQMYRVMGYIAKLASRPNPEPRVGVQERGA